MKSIASKEAIQSSFELAKSNTPPYTKVFAETLIKHAEQDTKIVGITGAMPSGTGLNLFEKRFPRENL